MVFRAKVPHNPQKEAWFGYWKDDGFVKTKHEGRVDKFGKWQIIKKRWLDNYRNRRAVPGESILQKVSADHEWCAEAYMETEYTSLKPEDFEKEMKKYVIFRVENDD
jgi:hypothetical protein